MLTKAQQALLVVVTLGVVDRRAVAESPAEAPRAAGIEGLWTDLATGDDTAVTRAILALSKDPKKTEAFLKSHLRPVKADARRVAALIADLDSNHFEVRQELEYLGKYIKSDLEKALTTAAGPEAKKRIRQLIVVPLSPSAYWVRALRAIAILEDIGTPAAKALVEELATGEADALPTEQAKAALAHWKK
jgi:hypothetical protein